MAETVYRCDRGCCHEMCIRRVPIFQTLSDEDMRHIAAIVRRRELPARAAAFREGDRLDELFIVRYGRLMLSRVTEDGGEHIIGLLSTGDFYGADCLAGAHTAQEQAVAAEDTGLCCLSGEKLAALMARHPDIALKTIRRLSEMQVKSRRLMHILLSRGAMARVAGLLLWQSEDAQDAPLRLSQEEMARMIGLTKETVNRKLASLRDGGIIRMDGYRALYILDREALNRTNIDLDQ